jgi:hypothetical protein
VTPVEPVSTRPARLVVPDTMTVASTALHVDLAKQTTVVRSIEVQAREAERDFGGEVSAEPIEVDPTHWSRCSIQKWTSFGPDVIRT